MPSGVPWTRTMGLRAPRSTGARSAPSAAAGAASGAARRSSAAIHGSPASVVPVLRCSCRRAFLGRESVCSLTSSTAIEPHPLITTPESTSPTAPVSRRARTTRPERGGDGVTDLVRLMCLSLALPALWNPVRLATGAASTGAGPAPRPTLDFAPHLRLDEAAAWARGDRAPCPPAGPRRGPQSEGDREPRGPSRPLSCRPRGGTISPHPLRATARRPQQKRQVVAPPRPGAPQVTSLPPMTPGLEPRPPTAR